MAGYVDPNVVSDEGTLAVQYLDSLADQIAGWEPHDGQVEPNYAEAVAVVAGAPNSLLKDAARTDYAGWGQTILNVAKIAATPATGTVTVVMDDADGHTLPAGAQLVGTNPAGEPVVLVTLTDAVVAAAATTVSGIPVASTTAGTAGNGATGLVDLQDPYEFVSTITLDAATGAGVDEEEEPDYDDRLVRRVRRFLGIPVTVSDFAEAALDTAGVARCMAINLLDPAHPDQQGTAAAEGHITLIPLDATGAAVSPTVAGNVITDLTGPEDRVIQVTLHTDDPTSTAITVTFSATVTGAVDGPSAIDAAEDAVTSYLSAALWAYDPDAPGRWSTLNTATVYYLEVAQVIQEVTGIDLVTDLQINGGTSNVALAGNGPLPNLTSVVGTLDS